MAATTSQWWRRRLVNAYEVKTGMVYLQGKSCVIYTECFSGSYDGVLYNYLTLTHSTCE